MPRRGCPLRPAAETSISGRSKDRRKTSGGSKSRPPKPFNNAKCTLPKPHKIPKPHKPPKPFRRPKSTKVKLKARTTGSSSGQFQTSPAQPEIIQGSHCQNRTDEYRKKGTIVVAKFVDSVTLILGFDSRIDKVSDPNWIGSEYKVKEVGPHVYSTMTGSVGKIKELWEFLEEGRPADFIATKGAALDFFRSSEEKKDDHGFETLIIGHRGLEAQLVISHLRYDKRAKPPIHIRDYTEGELAIGTGFEEANAILQKYKHKTQQKGETKRVVHEALLWSAVNVGSTGGDLNIARITLEKVIKVKSYNFSKSYSRFASCLMPPYKRDMTLFLITTDTCDKRGLESVLEYLGGREYNTHPLCNLRGKYQLRMIGFFDYRRMSKFLDYTVPASRRDYEFMESITGELRSFFTFGGESLVIATKSTEEFVNNLRVEKELTVEEDIRLSEPPTSSSDVQH